MILDLGHLDRATAGDTALRQELLVLFRGQLVEALAQVRATEAPVCDDPAAMLHRLRGGAEALGARQLAADLGAAEAGLCRAPGAAVRLDGARLRDSLQQTLDAVAMLIGEPERRGLAKEGESG